MIMSFGRFVKFWNWFEMFIIFFDFCWIEKKDVLLCSIFIETTRIFLYLEVAPKYI